MCAYALVSVRVDHPPLVGVPELCLKFCLKLVAAAHSAILRVRLLLRRPFSVSATTPKKPNSPRFDAAVELP
jgi:hypothetical protein